MATAIVELNDSEVRVLVDGRVTAQSPGYAVVVDDDVHIGAEGFRRSRLHPLNSYNQFWHGLSEQPLRRPTRLYRHQADLAFAHLQHVHEQAGRPGEMLFAVPGDMSRDQLALLLGLAGASPFKACGLVDSAVAAAAAAAPAGRYAHVDMHLHRTVVTALRVNSTVERQSVTRVERLGLQEVYAACANAVSEMFVRAERFDPLAEAATEQALYDHLPVWLGACAQSESIVLEMEFRGARHRARLERRRLEQALAPLWGRLSDSLPAGTPILLGDRAAGLPGLAAAFPSSAAVGAADIYTACAEHRSLIQGKSNTLRFVTRLPATASPRLQAVGLDASRDRTARAQTAAEGDRYVLAGFRALPLGDTPVYLHRSGVASMHRAADAGAAIVGHGDALVLSPIDDRSVYLNGTPIAASASVAPGDTLTLAESEHSFKIISAAPPHGT